MPKTIDHTGFTAPAGRALGDERRIAALAELVATAALALSTVVAVTAVSVGIARADAAGAAIGSDHGVFSVALLLGLIFFGVGGYAALPPRGKSRR
jgi:hypothetical protein